MDTPPPQAPGDSERAASVTDPDALEESGAREEAPQPATTPGVQSNMLPARERRRFGLERVLIRFVATGGIVGIGVALGAILAASKVQGWIIGLVIAVVSVVLSAMLWSSRQL